MDHKMSILDLNPPPQILTVHITSHAHAFERFLGFFDPLVIVDQLMLTTSLTGLCIICRLH